MLSFLAANIGTILVGLVLLFVIGGVVFHMIRQKKKGNSACGCGCDSCSACSCGGCANVSACRGDQNGK